MSERQAAGCRRSKRSAVGWRGARGASNQKFRGSASRRERTLKEWNCNLDSATRGPRPENVGMESPSIALRCAAWEHNGDCPQCLEQAKDSKEKVEGRQRSVRSGAERCLGAGYLLVLWGVHKDEAQCRMKPARQWMGRGCTGRCSVSGWATGVKLEPHHSAGAL